MVVVSEFVGCSPSVSGAIRVNPWSIDSVADGIYTAIQMPAGDRHLRHEKHWRYISGHTVGYWAQVFVHSNAWPHSQVPFDPSWYTTRWVTIVTTPQQDWG
jgi:trehalose-6-phosphate synthase